MYIQNSINLDSLMEQCPMQDLPLDSSDKKLLFCANYFYNQLFDLIDEIEENDDKNVKLIKEHKNEIFQRTSQLTRIKATSELQYSNDMKRYEQLCNSLNSSEELNSLLNRKYTELKDKSNQQINELTQKLKEVTQTATNQINLQTKTHYTNTKNNENKIKEQGSYLTFIQHKNEQLNLELIQLQKIEQDLKLKHKSKIFQLTMELNDAKSESFKICEAVALKSQKIMPKIDPTWFNFKKLQNPNFAYEVRNHCFQHSPTYLKIQTILNEDKILQYNQDNDRLNKVIWDIQRQITQYTKQRDFLKTKVDQLQKEYGKIQQDEKNNTMLGQINNQTFEMKLMKGIFSNLLQ
ncbi:Hypothetical_protein [Hexamita inflata]|uniref:Hypothetical_protein n=2 Tax=Hexamita inflata TaxID=28002 RepID=A0ABP1GDU7_9EUKA